ncbi:MAG: hypothetical protein HKN56_06205 [Gammaproteobacteria bacterium]|nr:hypothetical protein [Gammaproteobacteria bacterium]NND54546.1 hypothetical protein [Gammaproteobacteria bacterium]
MTEEVDVIERQPRVVDLGGRFTPAARERINDYLHSFVSFEPQLGLLYSEVGGQPSWSLAALGKATVDELVTMYSSFGAVVCYDIDGISAVVPQLAHIEMLDSGTLDFVGDRLQRVAKDTS